jgi:hypothetical protein
MVYATGIMVSAANTTIYAAQPMREMAAPRPKTPKNPVFDVFTKASGQKETELAFSPSKQ